MAIEIIDQEVDLAGKLRVRVDIDGETVAFKFAKWPGRAVVIDAARQLRRDLRVASRIGLRMDRLRAISEEELAVSEVIIRDEETVNVAS